MRIRYIIIAGLLLGIPLQAAGQTRKGAGKMIVKARMPGSPLALDSFVSATVRYPDEAREAGVEGRSVVRFMVDGQGEISRVETIRSSGSAVLDSEARRVVLKMPGWIPERRGQRSVCVYRLLPVEFRLED